jgi:hypothetical protein
VQGVVAGYQAAIDRLLAPDTEIEIVGAAIILLRSHQRHVEAFALNAVKEVTTDEA